MTPCEELGYKVGDRFEVTVGDERAFSVSSVVELYEDRGDDCPLFKLIEGRCNFKNLPNNEAGAYLPLWRVKKLPKEPQITLQEGDAVCLKGQPLDIRERVVQAFYRAGAGDTNHSLGAWRISEYIEWFNGDIYVAEREDLEPNARILTVEQVLSTGEEVSSEQPMNTKSDALERLTQAKESLDNAQKHLDDVMQEIQKKYPKVVVSFLEGGQTNSDNYSKDNPPPPHEWQDGDLVEIIKRNAGNYRGHFPVGAVVRFCRDRDGDAMLGDNMFFTEREIKTQVKWHSRPQK